MQSALEPSGGAMLPLLSPCAAESTRAIRVAGAETAYQLTPCIASHYYNLYNHHLLLLLLIIIIIIIIMQK